MFEESASAISSSIWASMNSWFTPTILFVILNIMIGTIAFTSTLSNKKHSTQNDPHHTNIVKSPTVLQRLKATNFSTHYRSQEPQSPSVYHKPTPDSHTHFNIEYTYQQTQSHYIFQENFQGNLVTPESQAHYVFEQEKPQESQAHFVFEEKDSNVDEFLRARKEKVEENGQSMDEVCEMKGSHLSRTKSDAEPASGEIPTKLPARMTKSASLKSPFGHFEEEDIVEARRPVTAREKGNAKVTDGDEEVDAKADDFINRFKQQLKLQRLDSIIRYKDMNGRGSSGR